MRNFILFAVMLFAVMSACEDPLVQDEAFSVMINSDEGGYRIQTCEDSSVVASSSSGELEATFFLPAEESPGRCYRVVFDYLDGFYTPEYVEKQLIIGVPVDAEGKYTSSEGTEMITVKTNIPDGTWGIESISDNDVVGSGPIMPNEGDEMYSYELFCNPESPGIGYKIYFGDVSGCITPYPETFELICGAPQNFPGVYQCN